MMMAETVRQNCILTVPSMVPGMWLVKINSTFFPAMMKARRLSQQGGEADPRQSPTRCKDF